MLFDEQFNYVSSSSGFQQVGNDNTLTVLGQSTIPITKNGYLYIYVSNETPNIDVYFDNLQVTHIRGPLLQEQAYYPFGLQMQGISSQALNYDKLPNSYKFNGGDELEESINLYSTFYRGYDPQLGRFNGVDVMSEQSAGMSPYHFGGNNPIMMNDPMGNLDEAIDYSEQWDRILSPIMNSENGGFWSSSTPNVDYLFGDETTANLFGSWSASESNGGGDGNPLEAVQNGIKNLIRNGYSVSDLQLTQNKNGDWGLKVGFNGGSNNEIFDEVLGQIVQGPVIVGSDWISLKQYNDQFNKTQEQWGRIFEGLKIGFGGSDVFVLQPMESILKDGARISTNNAFFKNAGKSVKRVTIGLNIIMMGMDLFEGVNNDHGWQAKNSIDMFTDGVSIVFPPFGVIWFLGDLYSLASTGKSLSENLGEINFDNLKWFHIDPATYYH